MSMTKDSKTLELNEEEARALVSFLYSIGYINQEVHPMIDEVFRKLVRFLNDREN